MVVRPRQGIIAVALATAACSTPHLATPDSGVAVPDAWTETEQVAASVDLTTYWRLLDDPLLTDFVEQAIVNNNDLAQSAARLDQARAQESAANEELDSIADEITRLRAALEEATGRARAAKAARQAAERAVNLARREVSTEERVT